MKIARPLARVVLVLAACARQALPAPAPVVPPSTIPCVVVEADASTTTQPPAVAVVQDAGALGRPSARQRRGVNLAGGQYASDKIPGTYDRDYAYPRAEEFAYFVARGFDHFRVGFLHERVQPRLRGPLDAAELARLRAAVREGTSRGARVAIVPHNSFRHGGRIVSEVEIGDLWGRLAQEFRGDPLVEIDVTNEPRGMSTELVAALDGAAVREIRRVGFAGLVWAPGNGWSGARHFGARFEGTAPSSSLMQGVADPGDNLAIEVHLYLDAANNGTGECLSSSYGAETIAPWIEWLRAHGRRGVVGEIGAIDTPTCRLAVAGALVAIDRASDVVLSWDAWAAGRWSFASTYPMALGPSTPEKPMLAVYRLFASPGDAGLDGSAARP